jgi:hypothetical protein
LKTGRKCEHGRCSGKLRDMLLDWDDALPGNHRNISIITEDDYENSRKYAKSADLVIALGTSMRVVPASKIPLITVKKGGKFVIVNLQRTPNDSKCHLKINSKCDEAMSKLMAALGYSVPSFDLVRNVFIRTHLIENIWQLEVSGHPGLLSHIVIDGETKLQVSNSGAAVFEWKKIEKNKIQLELFFQNELKPVKVEHPFQNAYVQRVQADTITINYNEMNFDDDKKQYKKEDAED